MMNARDDELQAALRDALDVEMSASFVARTRERAEADSAARLGRRRLWMRVALASALAGTTVLVVAWGRWSGRAIAKPVLVATHVRSSAPVSGAATSKPGVARERSARSGNRAEEPPFPPDVRSVSPSRTAAAGERPAAAEPVSAVLEAAGAAHAPEVLVPDDQRLALVRLIRDLRAGRATIPEAVGPQFDSKGLLMAPAPVVVPLLPDTTVKMSARDAGKD